MVKNMIIKNILKTALALILLVIGLRGEELGANSNRKKNYNSVMIGTVLMLKADFDVYQTKSGSRESPTFYYSLLPAPDTGIGGPEFDYLGRIPKGTKLQIIELRKGRIFSRPTYYVRPLSPINNNLEEHPSRKSVKAGTDLDKQIFKLRSTASPIGIYTRGKHADSSAYTKQHVV